MATGTDESITGGLTRPAVICRLSPGVPLQTIKRRPDIPHRRYHSCNLPQQRGRETPLAGLVAATAGFAAALNGMTGVSVPAVLLAFAPGGLAEMSLIALALGVDVAYVATHHVVRIFLIVALAPLVFKLLRHGAASRTKFR